MHSIYLDTVSWIFKSRAQLFIFTYKRGFFNGRQLPNGNRASTRRNCAYYCSIKNLTLIMKKKIHLSERNKNLREYLLIFSLICKEANMYIVW
ncbi:hypothetical protein PUN28_005195 [Cardiocondyla obscurior]|uniref:Ribosomal protein L20 n=1 Tax=Cardiocondyla obscurior TaxID=286306 RepID=A0AAW2GEN6_9HYME